MAEINLDGYIKIRNALDAIQNSTHPNCSPNINDSWEAHVLGVVMNVKPEDAVPVRHGRWEHHPEIGWGSTWLCSECGEKTVETVMGEPRYKFCPMCGVDMRKDGDDGKTG